MFYLGGCSNRAEKRLRIRAVCFVVTSTTSCYGWEKPRNLRFDLRLHDTFEALTGACFLPFLSSFVEQHLPTRIRVLRTLGIGGRPVSGGAPSEVVAAHMLMQHCDCE